MAEMSTLGTMTSATFLSRSFRILARRTRWSSLIGVSLSGVSSISSSIASRTASFFSRRRSLRRMARSSPPVEGTSEAGAWGAAGASLVVAGPVVPGWVLCAVEYGMVVKIGYRSCVAIMDVPYAFLQTSIRRRNAGVRPRHLAHGRKRAAARRGARGAEIRARSRLSDDRHGGDVRRRRRRKDHRRRDPPPGGAARHLRQTLP